jgi:hypothetical protein
VKEWKAREKIRGKLKFKEQNKCTGGKTTNKKGARGVKKNRHIAGEGEM